MTFRRLLVAFSVLLVAIVAAGWPVYVHPQTDPLRPADAVVVLGGKPYGRFHYGIDIAEQGYAPEVVLSNSVGPDDVRMQQICNGTYTVTVSCFLPDPYSTKGEAEEIKRRAAAENWKHIIVVTYTPHLSRSRYIVQQCFDGEVTMSPNPTQEGIGEWIGSYIYQTAGYIKAALDSECS
ncbi:MULTISPECIES: YdcF family protein [unclassified Rhodococcus (in: high G+C Gram-positive bacteria)]|uniref:YdcF family protein n=1 Tax=unclassified Rhodococcus (in: high G+C Gram-positive bacteria) TaxID=192944 RepID=UPI0006F6A7AD|nr:MULTISPECIES: YdcF family protein [unclassified Rhodococcus (in: high G+C Gram-positive bacteria)]KQU28337.1 hypothetical protein ASG69_09935 [Rhodococcus sp. Leaf225]KQU46444.1 hypothetical protein ASH03_06970 [Rhodococcus sp. Leaf258]